MPATYRTVLVVALFWTCGSCSSVPSRTVSAEGSISVDQPEIFDNAALQSQFDLLRGQLTQLGIVSSGTLTGALGNVQGTSISQSGWSLQVAAGMPSAGASAGGQTGSTGAAAGAAATGAASGGSGATSGGGGGAGSGGASAGSTAAPSLSLDAIGLINEQMELESQLQGYQLLLSGSDFARYTRDGLAKDKIVIGFPISIAPQPYHRNMAAVVDITYFPPNAGQFPQSGLCEQKAFKSESNGAHGNSGPEYRFSQSDEVNASAACEEQEATPTIINIIPTQRSYNVLGVTSSTQAIGLGAVVGTVNVGGTGSRSSQTQYLVAEQDTLALQGQGVVVCTDALIELAVQANVEHCTPGTRGISFQWQFRPVLGEDYVRSGIRRTFVQLAIPNVRRPYPYYGGIVYVKTTWHPYNRKTGVVVDALEGAGRDGVALPKGMLTRPGGDTQDGGLTVKNVFGHTFIASEVTSVDTFDQGAGMLQVTLQGHFLTGAAVRIGPTMLSTSTAGFIADYNEIQFVASAQAIAQSGAYLVSSDGVESPITLASACKDWDAEEECALKEGSKPHITKIRVSPVSDATSLVEVELDRSLRLSPGDCLSDPFPRQYFHYKRDADGDVKGDVLERVPNASDPHTINVEKLAAYTAGKPIVMTLGGKTFGFSDLPFQSISYPCNSDSSRATLIEVVALNDWLNSSSQVKIQTLFGMPRNDPDPQYFVPPGRVAVSADPQWLAAHAAGLATSAGKATTALLLAPSNQGAAQHPASASTAESTSGTTKSADPCEKKGPCHYVVSGADVRRMYIASPECPEASDCRAATPVAQTKCEGTVHLDEATTLENSARGLVTPPCARQVTLAYDSRSADGASFTGELTVPLAGKSVPPSAPSSGAVAKAPGLIPHFSLIRAVQEAAESGGSASVTVGIQNLKDQSATVTVTGAEIITAKDGAGNSIAVQVGNSVVVMLDTNITFQLRIYSLTQKVNVTAEGKNGDLSAGTLTFAQPFLLVKGSTPAVPGSAPTTGTQ
jgi:hypothetical protein